MPELLFQDSPVTASIRDACLGRHRIGHRAVRVVACFAALALIPMLIAHVVGVGTVNPLRDPISWYAFVPGGGELIFLGAILLAVLGVLLTISLYRRRVATGSVPALMMALFTASLLAVGAFPTDPPDTTSPSISAIIHRVAAATAFVVLPAFGLRVAGGIPRPRSRLPYRLVISARLLAAMVAVFLAIHLPLASAGSGIAAFGLLERLGFVIMIGYLFLIAGIIDHEAHPDMSCTCASRACSLPAVRRHTSSQGVGYRPSWPAAAEESIT